MRWSGLLIRKRVSAMSTGKAKAKRAPRSTYVAFNQTLQPPDPDGTIPHRSDNHFLTHGKFEVIYGCRGGDL